MTTSIGTWDHKWVSDLVSRFSFIAILIAAEVICSVSIHITIAETIVYQIQRPKYARPALDRDYV